MHIEQADLVEQDGQGFAGIGVGHGDPVDLEAAAADAQPSPTGGEGVNSALAVTVKLIECRAEVLGDGGFQGDGCATGMLKSELLRVQCKSRD